MAEVRKISVSMPAEVIEQVKRAAATTGESVSAWLSQAALRQLEEQSRLEIGRLEAERLVVEYEREFGPIPAREHAEVEEFFVRAEEALGAPGVAGPADAGPREVT